MTYVQQDISVCARFQTYVQLASDEMLQCIVVSVLVSVLYVQVQPDQMLCFCHLCHQ